MKKSFLLLSILLIAGYARAQVSIAGSPSFTINGRVAKDTIVIPLKLDGSVKWSDVTFNEGKPYLVRANMETRATFQKAINIVRDSGRLNVIVDLHALNKAGTYEVSVAYQSAAKQDLLVFSLVRPPAVLDTLGTVHLSFGGADPVCEPLALRESGNASDIDSLSLASPYFNALHEGNFITFSNKPFLVKAGGFLKADYAINQDLVSSFPLGKSSGKMIISAPQLTAPVVVNFEVLRKRSPWWIVWLTFFGLLFGFFVRVFLQKRRDIEKARIRGFTVIADIVDEAKTFGDPEFRNKVNDLLTPLKKRLDRASFDDAFGLNKSDTLSGQIDTTVTKYGELLAALKTALTQQKKAFDELASAIGNPDLSSDLQALLVDARKEMEAAAKSLKEQNPTAASVSLAKVLKDVQALIGNRVQYLAAVCDFVATPEAYPTSLREPARTTLVAQAAAIKTGLSGTAAPATGAEAKAALAKTDEAQKGLADFLQTVNKNVGADLEDQKAKPFADAAFELAYDRWLKSLQELVHHHANDTRPDTFAAAAAARALNDDFQRLDASGERMGGIRPRANIFPSLAARPSLTNAPIDTDFLTGNTASSIVLGRRGDSIVRFILFSVLQVVLLSLILGLFAYKFYSSSFIGTLDQMINIFFFAFTIDVTVDNVVAKVKQ